MAYLFRAFLPLLAAITLVPHGSWAMEDPAMAPKVKGKPMPAEYKRADANFYPKDELLKARPGAVIIPQGQYEEHGDSYFFTPKIRAPKELFFETTSDWVEPITPPDMPPSLGVAPDAMQIREPQGDVEVALPTSPATFTPVTANMTLPNGAVIKTGPNSTAAVLFGGVDSARLMPDSAAAVQQTVTAQSRSAEVDLTTGGVFSKVGTQIGVAGTYAVHTPQANASTQGGDFVTLNDAGSTPRTDVWAAKGTVDVFQPDGTRIGQVVADPAGALRTLRYPAEPDAALSLQVGVQELTSILNFIPLANQKVKGLREKAAQGSSLTTNEQAYLQRVKQVPALIKLDLVPTAPEPVANSGQPPQQQTMNLPASAPVVRSMTIYVKADGSVRFHGINLSVTSFKSSMQTISTTRPNQPFIVHATSDVPTDKVAAIQEILNTDHLKITATRIEQAADSTALPAPAAADTAPANVAITPVPAEPAEPGTPVPPPMPPTDVSSPSDDLRPRLTAPTISSGDRIIPLEVDLHAHGKLALEGESITLDQLKSRLTDIAKAIPNQPVVIRNDDAAGPSEVKKVLAICHELKLKARAIRVASLTPDASVPAAAASDQPVPNLQMHPAMQLSTGDGSAAPSASPPAVTVPANP